MDCWSVVDGTFDQNDLMLRSSFALKDNVACEAILSGVPAHDAEMICQEDTAQAMWNRFVDKQTKREYSNYIFARAEFYSNVYTSEKSMDQWLSEMESLHRQLLHYGKRVTDDDYAETLLGHVARTHRDVVRQFSKHYVVRRDRGADRPVPTATQVMNALRAESALDEKIGAEEQNPADVAACGKKSAPQKQQKDSQGRSKRERAGRGKKNQNEGKQGSKSSSKKSEKEETRTAFTAVKSDTT
ncbi:Retrovirus-related Gag-pol Polyprotein [Phytophthora cinnamomi]|uniref:Retrovirus-related Gag-pol Polyprotein n=1 Tax=Phytophthora cinnamomi TaxID=4785 RepID=UPI003559B507|nr:Retrovirus-related Gag-pol Polyprotein [Phytophthora cinnamomi]